MAVDRMLVIVGPTASGKSDVALTLARGGQAEVLSVDSMQVYRGMDIGTAKPSRLEQAEARHHLIDLIEPTETFMVARFVELADRVIAEAITRDTALIAAGGTPLYYKSLFQGLFEGPGQDAELRDRLLALPNEELASRLARIDAAAAQRIHAKDTRRMVRALEVFELTGKPISSFQTEWARAQARHPGIWIGLSWDRETLNRRINARVGAMLQAGWIEEVQGLLNRYGSLSKTAAEATGYSELIDLIQGRCTMRESAERIKIATRQLARRQMKWLRRFPGVQWLDGNRPVELIAKEARQLWVRSGRQ